MGIAMPFGAYRPAVSSSFAYPAGTRRPTSAPFADFRDRPSGCFSNQHRQRPPSVEVVDAKWQIQTAFARTAAGRRGSRETPGLIRWRRRLNRAIKPESGDWGITFARPVASPQDPSPWNGFRAENELNLGSET